MSGTAPGGIAPGAAALEPVAPRLFATPTAPLPYLAGVVVRSFVLQRAHGNVIVYNSPGIDLAAAGILELERPTRLLINHWHEAMYPAPVMDIPVSVHRDDRRRTERALPVADVFTGRGMIDDDLEVIPTPGHTPGATMYLWDSGERRYLFTGDSIWVHGGRWQAVLLDEGDRSAYLASLELVRDLDFDVLVPWGADVDGAITDAVAVPETRRRIDAMIARLRSGSTE